MRFPRGKFLIDFTPFRGIALCTRSLRRVYTTETIYTNACVVVACNQVEVDVLGSVERVISGESV